MADRAVAEADRSRLGVERKRAVERLAVEQREDAVQRPDPAERCAPPAHGFRPGHGADRRCRAAPAASPPSCRPSSRSPRRRTAPLISCTSAWSIDGEAGGFEEALDRLLGRADARALALLACVGLLARAGRRRRARGGAAWQRRRRASKLSPAAFQLLGHQTLQVLRRARLHARGDFLGEEFEREAQASLQASAGAVAAALEPAVAAAPSRARARGRYRTGARSR